MRLSTAGATTLIDTMVSTENMKNCEICGKKAKSEEAMKCHMLAAHPRFSCNDCESKFNVLNDFENHLELHRELNREPMPLRKRQRIELVETNDVLDVDPLEDDYADRDYEVTKEDEKTIEDDQEDYDFAYNCDKCNFMTNHAADLKNHKKFNHNIQKKVQNALMVKTSTKKQNYECEKCGKSFSQAYNLRRHLDKIHNK